MKNTEIITLEMIQKAYRKVGPFISRPAENNDADTDDYFCIGTDGNLWVLGNHGDHEAAEETAASLLDDGEGNSVVWLFGKDTAMDWRDILVKEIPNSVDKTPSLVAAPEILKALQHVAEYLDELSENYETGCAPPGLTCAKQHVNEALLWLFT